ncbi:hypothetical protein SDRG_02567 [Saprolegnia diclina VS20]|uniref:Uncharacterized protein n=1 Tax=Saprolegnia diclina (strain VS20) TaxID=1156394 RepID=T0QYZ0_SAPDV|nr:hypothetical protein SDRG_02567 [Saprolegnia diclina VS20]EQC39911.1 hypothetical protein SDRG_02567 [Saprolegnia diclina VS20]|eukprot:XP_008606385.1 hypothetical protein SDRG_02567 [Saprolegnia diclina VS20]
MPGLVPNSFGTEEDWYGRNSDFVKNILLLEHFVTTTAPQLHKANYVGHRLPPVLVAAVDAYLFAPRPSIMAKHGYRHVIDCIVRAVTDPTLNGHTVLCMRVKVIQSILHLALATNRVDAAFFEKCVKLWDLKLLPALRTLRTRHCPNFSKVTPFVNACVPPPRAHDTRLTQLLALQLV